MTRGVGFTAQGSGHFDGLAQKGFVLSKIVHVGVTEHDVVQLHVASNLITIPERHSLRVLVWRLGEVPTQYGLIALVESSL